MKSPPPPVPKRKPKGSPSPSDASLMLLVNDSRLENTSEPSENHESTQLRTSKLPPSANTPGSSQEQQSKRENTQLRKDLAALQKKIDAVHDALEDTHDALQAKVDLLAVIQQDYTALQKQSQSAQSELKTSRAQIVTLKNKLDIAQNQIREKKDMPSSPPSTDDAISPKKQDELLYKVRKLQQEKQELQQVHDNYVRKSEQEQHLLKRQEDDSIRERETLEAAGAPWEQAKSKLLKKHKKEKDDLQERLEVELYRERANSLKQMTELNDTLDALVAKHEREINRLTAQHSSDLEQLQNKHAETLEENRKLRTELSSARTEANLQVVSNSHAAEIEELRRLKDFFQNNSERLSKELKLLKSKNRATEESARRKDSDLEDQSSHNYALEEQMKESRTQESMPGGWE